MDRRYSFGVVIWEILTGGLPWEGSDVAQITRAVCDKKKSPLDARNAPSLKKGITGTPGGRAVVALMTQCLAPTPDARPTFSRCVRQLDTSL